MSRLLLAASSANTKLTGRRTILACLCYLVVAIAAWMTGMIDHGQAINAIFEAVIGIFLRLGLTK